MWRKLPDFRAEKKAQNPVTSLAVMVFRSRITQLFLNGITAPLHCRMVSERNVRVAKRVSLKPPSKCSTPIAIAIARFWFRET